MSTMFLCTACLATHQIPCAASLGLPSLRYPCLICLRHMCQGIHGISQKCQCEKAAAHGSPCFPCFLQLWSLLRLNMWALWGDRGRLIMRQPMTTMKSKSVQHCLNDAPSLSSWNGAIMAFLHTAASNNTELPPIRPVRHLNILQQPKNVPDSLTASHIPHPYLGFPIQK